MREREREREREKTTLDFLCSILKSTCRVFIHIRIILSAFSTKNSAKSKIKENKEIVVKKENEKIKKK
jgi:hypothetical protein